MSSARIIRITVVFLFVFSGIVANAETFNVSKVSWASDGLRIEIKTDLQDETELNLCITDDKNGFNCVSDTKSFTVKGGRSSADGFAADVNDEPFHPGTLPGFDRYGRRHFAAYSGTADHRSEA